MHFKKFCPNKIKHIASKSKSIVHFIWSVFYYIFSYIKKIYIFWNVTIVLLMNLATHLENASAVSHDF